MTWRSGGILAIALALAGTAPALAENQGLQRSGYSYIRDVRGDVTIDSRWNGRVEARRNMPIAAGDEIIASDSARAEIGLADGNLLHVGGGTRARFLSLRYQQGEDDDFSAIRLEDGSLILTVAGSDDTAIPRIDTEDATVYLNPGARARVNYDRRRGTAVIARAGSVEVRTPEGRYKLRAGEYLMARGNAEPEIARGSFSRDRFDIWSADRIDSLYETRSASARYVDQEYASDVVALDGYGDWSYSDTYSTHVWRPRVSAGWTPYSYGSWYYTPAGLTWWSYDPWGWYPFHYGNWFFDASWNRWCWAPASVYSPAWVYWAYTPSYVGWCPTGYYSFYSPWFHNYYRNWGLVNRSAVYISINGTFPTRTVDFRGWNFVGVGSLTTAVNRMEVIPGAGIADRLGGQVAISSRPIVVNALAGAAREAIGDFIREAPRVIERTSPADSSRLAPILARERTLPPATVSALRERAVVADRGRLAGPSAADVAPRGAIVERGRDLSSLEVGISERARGAVAPAPAAIGRGRGAESETPRVEEARPEGRGISRPAGQDGWRGRGNARSIEAREAPARERSDGSNRESAREVARPERSEGRPSADRPRVERDPSAPSDWRTRSRSAPAASPEGVAPVEPPREQWRSRQELPPARRVIEGSIPGRHMAEPPSGTTQQWRAQEREAPAPAPREHESRPEVAPPPRVERAPSHSAPPPPPPPDQPRAEVHREAPAREAPPARAPEGERPSRGREPN